MTNLSEALRRVLCLAMTAGAAAMCPTAASAATYVFDGHQSPTNSGAGNILNYVDRHAPLTFQFTTDAPLSANLTFATISSLVTNWTASGGSVASTITSTDTSAKITAFQVNTDSAGTITRYNISVGATNATLPGKQWQYSYSNTDPNNVFEEVELDTLQYNGLVHYTTIDSILLCGPTCGTAPTGCHAAASASAVPEPGSWAVMIAGVGLIGGALRRRRTDRRDGRAHDLDRPASFA